MMMAVVLLSRYQIIQHASDDDDNTPLRAIHLSPETVQNALAYAGSSNSKKNHYDHHLILLHHSMPRETIRGCPEII